MNGMRPSHWTIGINEWMNGRSKWIEWMKGSNEGINEWMNGIINEWMKGMMNERREWVEWMNK